MRKDLRRLCKQLLKISVVLSLLFAAMALGFKLWGSRVLPGLAKSLSEVAMEQGERREAVGNLDEARRFYEQALAGHFHGEANQNHCEKRLGVVLTRLGKPADALPYLVSAQASPHRSLNGFGPLVEVLMAQNRWEEAKREADRWLAESRNDLDNHAKALRALGEIALHDGELDAAEVHFQSAIDIDANHAARAGLAKVYAARGDRAKARDTMIAYLASAAADDNTAANWALLDSVGTDADP